MTLFSWFTKTSIETIDQPVGKLPVSRNKSMWPITIVGNNNDNINHINQNLDSGAIDSNIKSE